MSNRTDDSSTAATDLCEQLFATFLERHHETGADPEVLFAAHPEHAPTLRRWWDRLVALGQVRTAGPGGDRFGPYVLLRRLGTGAQGTVHLATDTRLGRQVALKILPLHRAVREDALARFRREAEVASRIEHPGICTVYEAGEIDGAAYIAMRHVEGQTLAERLAAARAANRLPPLEQTLALAEQIARSLHAAHETGLVHRDIKPGNIMVTPEHAPVVLDFGLARDDHEGSDLTRTGDLLGTPAYMSPEQLHGGHFTVDARTDVYSLGVTLYECLTLRRPFEAPTQEKLLQCVLAAPVPDPRQWRPDLDREVVLVLMTALAKDRDHRYASAAHLAEDLRRLRARESVLARPLGLWRRLSSWRRQRPRLAAGLALVLFFQLGATVVSLLLWRAAVKAQSDYASIADLDRLQAAKVDANRLHPAGPELVSALRDWLEQHGRPLAAGLPMHRETLRQLRLRALPRAEPDDERARQQQAYSTEIRDLEEQREGYLRALESARSPQSTAVRRGRLDRLDRQIAALQHRAEAHDSHSFADAEIGFFHGRLAELVEELEAFVAPDNVLASVEQRLSWAQSVVQVTVIDRADEWRSAAQAVADDARYDGRRLVPQVGLVPLGTDPHSGLQEFALARAGSVPVRAAESEELQLDASSAPVLVLVPPIAFTMGARRRQGSPALDPEAELDEGPPFHRPLDWFFIGKHELTRGQWRRMGADDEPLLSNEVLGDDADMHPITDVSWWRCTEVLAWHGLRLPSEARWEGAARAGSTSPYWTGSDAESLIGAGNFRDAGDDGYELTAPVYTMRANKFGLHHTAGNVAEWCREATRGGYVPSQSRDGDGELISIVTKSRSVRGGSFQRPPATGRSAARAVRNGDTSYAEIGVRVVRVVTDGP